MNQSPSFESYQSSMGEDIRKVFCRQKSRLRNSLFQRMQSVDSCETVHKARLGLEKKQDSLKQILKMLSTGNVLQMFVIGLSVCFLYIIWAARKHNHALLFGNGGCMSTSYWTEDDCKVAF